MINKTTWLILPMVLCSKNIKILDVIHSPGFKSAYIGDLYRPELDDKILMIYDDHEDVCEIPKEFVDDYWKIICSQYHEVSDSYWKVATECWGGSFKPPRSSEDEFSIFEEIYGMTVY